jgi:hypothetical protein
MTYAATDRAGQIASHVHHLGSFTMLAYRKLAEKEPTRCRRSKQHFGRRGNIASCSRKMRRGELRRISPSSRSCCAKPKTIAAQPLSVGIVRKGDQGRKTGAAFRAMPNVTSVVVAPVLGSHRRNQVSTALNAMHHVNLLTKMYSFR